MKVVKKLLSSFAKRKNILLGNGFSVKKVYDCKWLIDWSNTVDKKMAYKLFEDEQINYFINNINVHKPEYFFESTLQFLRTFGFTIPQPRISNHLSPNKTSTSADGSVKGK